MLFIILIALTAIVGMKGWNGWALLPICIVFCLEFAMGVVSAPSAIQPLIELLGVAALIFLLATTSENIRW